MKIYKSGATIIIDKGETKKTYFPTLSGSFYFEGDSTIVVDERTNKPYYFDTVSLQNQAGGTIGNEAAVETYLAAFVGQSFNTSVTDSIDTVEQNLSDHEANVTDAHDLVNRLASKQPLDSDLTAIAALTTDSFGRDLLIKTSAANIRSYIGAGTGNGDALVANPLSQFASTTSAQLAGVLSDETGTGVVVFGTAPTLTYPIIAGNTRATIIATTPTAGTTAWATDDKKMWLYNGTTWQVQGETIELINKAGAPLVVGDIVQVSTGTNLACQYPTIYGDSDLIGVVAIGGADGSSVTIAIHGIWNVSVLLATTRENFLTNSITTLYYGTDNGSGAISGNFAYILESNATVTVKLVKCLIGFTGETF